MGDDHSLENNLYYFFIPNIIQLVIIFMNYFMECFAKQIIAIEKIIDFC